MALTGFNCFRMGSETISFEHGDEKSDSIKDEVFLYQMSDYYFLKRVLLHGVCYVSGELFICA
jgi:hypothetical protein